MNPLAFRAAFALLTAGMLLTTTSHANQPRVSATVSADSVQVAEPLTLTISVQAEQAAKVAFPELPHKLGAFDVRDVQDVFDVPHASHTNLRTWTRRLTLESIETGQLHIPPLDIQVTQAGKTAQLSTQPIAVRVASVLEDRSDPSKFRDIQSVVDLPIPAPQATRTIPWMAVVSLGLVGLALSCAAVVVYRRRQRLTPLAWSTRQLDVLHPDSPDAAEQLALILREFLTLQFEVPDAGAAGRGRSAAEIIQSLLELHAIETPVAERLRAIFEVTDQARFAGLRLSPDETRRAIAAARELVTALAAAAP